MKKYIIFLFWVLITSGISRSVNAQFKIQMIPEFRYPISNVAANDYGVEFYLNSNLTGTLQISNQFGQNTPTLLSMPLSNTGTKFNKHTSPLMKWPISSNSPISANPEEVGITSPTTGRLTISGVNGTNPYYTYVDYAMLTEANLIAIPKINDAGILYIPVSTPTGDATCYLKNTLISPLQTSVKRLLISSSDNDVLTGNSTTNVAGQFPILPAGWQVVSNSISLTISNQTTAIYTLDNDSKLKIKYEDYGLLPADENNMAVFRWEGNSWLKIRCIGEYGTTIDTLNNSVMIGQIQPYGTYVLAAMENTIQSKPVVLSNTISYRYAGERLSLGGSVDSTGMLVAFAGKEIVLFPGFTARPGSVLSFNLTGSYCGTRQPPSSVASTRKATDQAERNISNDENQEQSNELFIYPNPTSSSFTIVYHLASPQRVRIAIKDFSGREIKLLQDGYQDESTYKQTYQTDGISLGIYFVELITEIGGVKVVKLIKQ